MTQAAAILTRTGAIQVELPGPDAELLPGVRWGSIDAFPTPAYFAYQVIARRLTHRSLEYRLGRTLAEEVGACLLGGHGIPAAVGVAAYEHLRAKGAFLPTAVPTTEQLTAWLKEPVQLHQRTVYYRFAAQKARYLGQALPVVHRAPAFNAGLPLRNWLLDLPGIGPKTASWIARNWLQADDVAILDVHILRVGQFAGVFPAALTVERHYFELEQRFLSFSEALEVRPSELDAVIWYEMASSPRSVRRLTEHLTTSAGGLPKAPTASANRNLRLQFA